MSIKCPPQYENLRYEDIVVWVDPLDGTNEYTRVSNSILHLRSVILSRLMVFLYFLQGRVEYVTVLIGITIKGKAIGGIIHQPYTSDEKKIGRTLWGIVGYGVGGFKPKDPPSGLVIVTTRTHSTGIVERSLAALNPDVIIRIGGAGTKVIKKDPKLIKM